MLYASHMLTKQASPDLSSKTNVMGWEGCKVKDIIRCRFPSCSTEPYAEPLHLTSMLSFSIVSPPQFRCNQQLNAFRYAMSSKTFSCSERRARNAKTVVTRESVYITTCARVSEGFCFPSLRLTYTVRILLVRRDTHLLKRLRSLTRRLYRRLRLRLRSTAGRSIRPRRRTRRRRLSR